MAMLDLESKLKAFPRAKGHKAELEKKSALLIGIEEIWTACQFQC
jgi:hypothetical protein